jgi:hypothetical protein
MSVKPQDEKPIDPSYRGLIRSLTDTELRQAMRDSRTMRPTRAVREASAIEQAEWSARTSRVRTCP